MEPDARKLAVLFAMLAEPKGTLEQWGQLSGITGKDGFALRGSVSRIIWSLARRGWVVKNRYGFAVTFSVKRVLWALLLSRSIGVNATNS